MFRKALVVVAIVVVVGSLGLFFWARSVFARDTVRTALAGQLSKAIGQPVTIASIAASIYPRVTVDLGDVSIGAPARISVKTLKVGTDFRALFSRQISHATLRLDGAKVELPLPPLFSGAAASSTGSGSAPVEIVSIDEVVLNAVEIVSGGRTLRGDIEVVPHQKGATIRKLELRADDADVNVTGEITDFSGPVGTLAVKADTLHFERLMAFVSDFSGGSGMAAATAPATAAGRTPASPAAPPMNLSVSLEAGRAMMGALTLDRLAGRARVTPQGMALDPIGFGLFNGRYEGKLNLTLGQTPAFQLQANVSDIDVAAATAFAGSPNVMSGRLSGRLNLVGVGMTADAVSRSSRGTARVDVRDGVVQNLGLLRAVVLATSMRSDSTGKVAGGSSAEPFTRLGATLSIANGLATTNDLRFESKDLSLAAGGSLALNGSAVNLKGNVQLSQELSQQAGRDLVRYTQDQGRVTIPATITGSAQQLSPGIDVGSLAERALKNRANEEVSKVLKGKLGGFFK